MGEERVKKPIRGKNTYIAPGAVVLGDVELGDEVNIWFNAVVRADNRRITIGAGTNIQDNCVLHVEKETDVTIGRSVTVGHSAIVHGCTVGDNTLIGMGAIVMSRAVIGRDCVIGAGALVTEGAVIPDGSVVVGRPGKVVRQVTEKEIAWNKDNVQYYIREAAGYREETGE